MLLTSEQFQSLSAEKQDRYLGQFKKTLEEIEAKFEELRKRLKNCIHKFDVDDLGDIKNDPEYIQINKEIKELNEEAVSIMFK